MIFINIRVVGQRFEKTNAGYVQLAKLGWKLQKSFDPLNLHKDTTRMPKRSIKSPQETSYHRRSFRTTTVSIGSIAYTPRLDCERRKHCFSRSESSFLALNQARCEHQTITLKCSILINERFLSYPLHLPAMSNLFTCYVF